MSTKNKKVTRIKTQSYTNTVVWASLLTIVAGGFAVILTATFAFLPTTQNLFYTFSNSTNSTNTNSTNTNQSDPVQGGQDGGDADANQEDDGASNDTTCPVMNQGVKQELIELGGLSLVHNDGLEAPIIARQKAIINCQADYDIQERNEVPEKSLNEAICLAAGCFFGYSSTLRPCEVQYCYRTTVETHNPNYHPDDPSSGSESTCRTCRISHSQMEYNEETGDFSFDEGDCTIGNCGWPIAADYELWTCYADGMYDYYSYTCTPEPLL